MANILQKFFGESPLPPPTQIIIKVTASSATLHKYGSKDPFTLTIEANLPEFGNASNKPLTILTFDTLLDPSSDAHYGNGFDMIDGDRGSHPEYAFLTRNSTFGDRSGILIDPQYERYFVTLEPGVPYRVTHTIIPCPRPPAEIGVKSGAGSNIQQEGVTTAEDENVVAEAFSHVTSLNVGSVYLVQLGDKMSRISWYRYGSKEEVLRGQSARGGLLQALMGPKRHHERVGDSEMQAIPLVVQGTACFTVEE